MRTILLNDTEIESHYGCSKVKESILDILKELSWPLVSSIPTGTPIEEIREVLEKTSTYDVLLINGEGTLHDNNSYSKTILSACIDAKKSNKHIILINSSIYLTTESYIEIIKNNIDLIFVRSRITQEELNRYEIQSTFTPDLSFYENHEKKLTTPAPNSNLTAHIANEHTYTDSVSIEKTARLILSSINNSGIYTPFFCPPKNKKNPTLRYLKRHINLCKSWRDYALIAPVFAYNLYSIKKTNSKGNKKIDELLINSRKVTTGRFHTACFCIRLGIPFDYVTSNTQKIEDLTKDSKIDHLFIRRKNGTMSIPEEKHAEFKSRALEFKEVSLAAYHLMHKKMRELQESNHIKRSSKTP